MFDRIYQAADRHVVIPDLHGEIDIAEQAVDRYIDQEDVSFVFLGDVLDRKGLTHDEEQGVRRTVELIRSLGNRAVLVIANHEIYPLAAMFSKAGVRKQAATQAWLGDTVKYSMERNTLSAYDIATRDESAPDLFKSALETHDHLRVLTSATPYFETDKFIAVHAGVMPNVDWEEQKNYLTDTARDMAHGIFFDQPPQWFSIQLATSTDRIAITEKAVVSGHAHYVTTKRNSNEIPERVLHDGKRIRLASMLNAPENQNLFVWQDWDGQIIEIPRESES